MKLSYEQILTDLKNKKYSPIYFLIGDESYYIDEITNYITQNVLAEEEKAFNQIILYGRDTDVGNVINTAKRFPMMSDYQVIVLKEAQYLKKIEDLHYYTDNPVDSTIFVINYKYSKLDRRKKLYTSIDKKGVILESKRLYDYQIPQWMNQYLKERNYSIDQKAASLLIEFLGNDLEKIANELNKLFIIVPVGSKITPEIIEKNIGISKEFNTFELQKSLGTRNISKTFEIIEYLGKNQNTNHISITLGLLFLYFTRVMIFHDYKNHSNGDIAAKLKINPYFIKEYKIAAANYSKAKLKNIISLLREYDTKSKGIGNASAPAGELLKEMVFRILH